jgi:hypothetical protein
MKESYAKGPASHGVPESCAEVREDLGEALTGAHTGGVSSRENTRTQGADAVVLCGRQHSRLRNGEQASGPARSETSNTCGTSLCENRETPCLPAERDSAGRVGKATSRNPTMHEHGESDRPIVPTRTLNKAGQPAAEAEEGRGLTKENVTQHNMRRTLRRESVPNGLDRVRQAEQRLAAIIRGKSRMR